jgi:peptidoglycan/xylan/chitin deacetylase (PgdA/CDA1 family)
MKILPEQGCSKMAGRVNAMTVDVEDYFQVSAFEGKIRRDEWDQRDCRVQQNTERILTMFGEFGVNATFYMLGWVAERYPQLVRQIVDAGHELASHGYSHIRVVDQTLQQFRQDVTRTKKLLEDTGGQAVVGYRAASYSIGADNLWALDVLGDAGYQYSFPAYTLFGMTCMVCLKLPDSLSDYGREGFWRSPLRRSQSGTGRSRVVEGAISGFSPTCFRDGQYAG